MKKALKITSRLLLGLIVLLGIAAAYIQLSPLPKYEVKLPDIPQIKADSTMIAEGRRTFSLVCNNCHMAESGKLEGKFLPEIPAMFGKAWSANITSHPVYGSGKYTSAELAFLLRTGIQRDGDFAPFMPQFPRMSDSDVQNIIAYLRSDAPELAPSEAAQPAMQPSFFGKLLFRTVMKPMPYPSEPVPDPPTGDALALGKYLVTAKLDCYSCHSPDFKTVNSLAPEKTPGYLSGGNLLQDMDGNPIVSRNLTPDKETGLGNWTEEQFVLALRSGIRPNGPALRFPMVPFTALTDEESKAIWAYLKTVPAIKNDVEKSQKAELGE